jgi:hypothetical protein
LLRVPAVFPQDAPSVINGAHDGILIGIIHNGPRKFNRIAIQDWGGILVPRSALRFYVSEAIAIVARCVHKPRL